MKKDKEEIDAPIEDEESVNKIIEDSKDLDSLLKGIEEEEEDENF